MTKYIRIIRFIKKYRKLGVASFSVVTNSDTFILYVKERGYDDQLRLKY